MDNLFIVFVVLIFLAILICFKKLKGKTIVEGMSSSITDAQLESSVGLCYPQGFLDDSDVTPIWPSTEEECLQKTGFTLDFKTKEDKYT
mgnify:CR=1 FL=1